jgi:hypothetical protein
MKIGTDLQPRKGSGHMPPTTSNAQSTCTHHLTIIRPAKERKRHRGKDEK